MAIQNILPDPFNKITDAGEVDNVNGAAGPGFASVKLSSEQPIMRDRTNSGRLITRASAFHKWIMDISYNPLTLQEFSPVYNFLLHKQGSLTPFFVFLPQYRNQGITNKSVSSNTVAGSTTLPCTTTGISPGALFRIVDSQDSAHTKAYMVTRVGTSSITITPGLAKYTNAGATIDFQTPLIKVIQTSDVQEYSLGNNNLYSFSLKLEEVSN